MMIVTEGDAPERQTGADRDRIRDQRIERIESLAPPAALLNELPLPEHSAEVVIGGRNAVSAVLEGSDDRLLVVVGPCSVHDVEAAAEYATRLSARARELHGDLLVVMRVYFEKPRTTTGWKGLINDPHLDDSGDVNTGLRMARRLLLDVSSGYGRLRGPRAASRRSTSPTPLLGATRPDHRRQSTATGAGCRAIGLRTAPRERQSPSTRSALPREASLHGIIDGDSRSCTRREPGGHSSSAGAEEPPLRRGRSRGRLSRWRGGVPEGSSSKTPRTAQGDGSQTLWLRRRRQARLQRRMSGDARVLPVAGARACTRMRDRIRQSNRRLWIGAAQRRDGRAASRCGTPPVGAVVRSHLGVG